MVQGRQCPEFDPEAVWKGLSGFHRLKYIDPGRRRGFFCLIRQAFFPVSGSAAARLHISPKAVRSQPRLPICVLTKKASR